LILAAPFSQGRVVLHQLSEVITGFFKDERVHVFFIVVDHGPPSVELLETPSQATQGVGDAAVVGQAKQGRGRRQGGGGSSGGSGGEGRHRAEPHLEAIGIPRYHSHLRLQALDIGGYVCKGQILASKEKGGSHYGARARTCAHELVLPHKDTLAS
jgi:hypothetical protein